MARLLPRFKTSRAQAQAAVHSVSTLASSPSPCDQPLSCYCTPFLVSNTFAASGVLSAATLATTEPKRQISLLPLILTIALTAPSDASPQCQPPESEVYANENDNFNDRLIAATATAPNDKETVPYLPLCEVFPTLKESGFRITTEAVEKSFTQVWPYWVHYCQSHGRQPRQDPSANAGLNLYPPGTFSTEVIHPADSSYNKQVVREFFQHLMNHFPDKCSRSMMTKSGTFLNSYLKAEYYCRRFAADISPSTKDAS